MCLQVQNSKDATDKMINHLGKFKKELERCKKVALQAEVNPPADASGLVWYSSRDKGPADVVQNVAADTGRNIGDTVVRAPTSGSNDSSVSVTSVLRGISTRALELCRSVAVIHEGERETFTRALTMFEALPPHEPFWPAQRMSGAAWEESDLRRFMLYRHHNGRNRCRGSRAQT